MNEKIHHYDTTWAFAHQYGKWCFNLEKDIEWSHHCNTEYPVLRSCVEFNDETSLSVYMCPCGSRIVITTNQPNYPEDLVNEISEELWEFACLLK